MLRWTTYVTVSPTVPRRGVSATATSASSAAPSAVARSNPCSKLSSAPPRAASRQSRTSRGDAPRTASKLVAAAPGRCSSSVRNGMFVALMANYPTRGGQKSPRHPHSRQIEGSGQFPITRLHSQVKADRNLVKCGSEQIDDQTHRSLRSSATVVPVIHFDNVHTKQVAFCAQARQKIVELEETQPSRFESARSRRNRRIHHVHIHCDVNVFTLRDLAESP